MKPGKGKAAAGEDAKAAAEYYKLHKQAVEDLAGADESNSPEVSEEELKKLDPKIFAAMQASKRQEGQPKAQPAPTSPNYAQQAQPNPTQAAPIRANAATVPQRVAASPAPRPAATPQPAPVATRPANAPRRQAAPTY